MPSNNFEPPKKPEDSLASTEKDSTSSPRIATPKGNEDSCFEEDFQEVRRILARLEGRRLITPVRRQSNLIREITNDYIEVATVKSPRGARVPWSSIKAIYIELRKRGILAMRDIAKERKDVAFRASFIFALLLELPHISTVSIAPFTIEYRNQL